MAAVPASVSWAVLLLHGLVLGAGFVTFAVEVAAAEVDGMHMAGPYAESVCPSGRLSSP